MRYVLRNEFFGSLAYDSRDKDYLHLDPLATRLLRAPSRPLSEAELAEHEACPAEADQIRSELADRGLLGNTRFLGNRPKTGYLSAPTQIFLEITYRCPEKCNHCYTDSGAMRDHELNRQEKIGIVDQMAEIGCFRLSIVGGEPLVDRDFFPVVERAIEHGIDVSFSTSGIPVTEKTAAGSPSSTAARSTSASTAGMPRPTTAYAGAGASTTCYAACNACAASTAARSPRNAP